MASIARSIAAPRSAAVVRESNGDLLGVGAFLLLAIVATRDMWFGGTMIGTDSSSFFYPMFSFMGERLNAFDIPGWNPHQFAGAPFAADPESGWMYLPAMLTFSVFPFELAVRVSIVFPILLAGLSTYALARVLGLNALGALLASAAYSFSGFSYAMSPCCPIFLQVAAWMPGALLGIELAIRARSWLARIAWLGMAGLALSQVLAAWLGQGSYYALLVIGSYTAYRTLLDPPVRLDGFWRRLAALGVHGGSVLVFGFGLAAAGWLPRLEYVGRSNLSDGYEGWHAAIGGWEWSTIPDALLARSAGMYYAGAVVIALALYAPRIARRSFATPYFVALSVGVLVIALPQTTPLHSALYLLPRFEELHQHFPDRVLMLFYLGPALLAGATVTMLRRLPIVPGLLVLLAIVDLLSVGPMALSEGGEKVDPAAFFAQREAGTFLKGVENDQPFRYFGYNPVLSDFADGSMFIYVFRWPDDEVAELLVNNRATLHGLEDIQGYNPLQPKRYSEFVTALNGYPQDYHGTNVFAAGFESPLLDLLGVRYTVVPAEVPPGRPDLLYLSQRWPTVYQDKQVRILENGDALPRAWLVHEARQVARGEALPLLASGAVDPRRIALIEGNPPHLPLPNDRGSDAVAVVRHEPDRIEYRTRSQVASLLVLSESYDPAWRAYVNGKPADLYVADHAFRAVAVPAGEHRVDLRYESAELQTGLIVTGSTSAGLGAVWVAAAWMGLRRRRPVALKASKQT